MQRGTPNKKYTGEFKQMVVETMMREKLGYREAARQFEAPDHKDIAKWEWYYLSEGPEGLDNECRGRGAKGRPATFSKDTEGELLAEVTNTPKERRPAEYEPKG